MLLCLLFTLFSANSNSNTIKITVHTSSYCVLDLLCVKINEVGNPRMAEMVE